MAQGMRLVTRIWKKKLFLDEAADDKQGSQESAEAKSVKYRILSRERCCGPDGENLPETAGHHQCQSGYHRTEACHP